ncbi:hypothetical protein A2V68_00585 [candidate division Kazan bacterium RBG_13_50_9]|uniref:Uncharacterized protein n=1 Tax=candidate division Kazan bacterium RBG_13_50_9 TaxID=1798535 RepID=A0A1F4NS51_UNCK3|nr:MAG: hypothetical protein A2V68_00585 [candidate division Kazan bacterium RBG_13_50_9]
MPKSGRRFMPPQDLSDALSSRAFERPAPTRGSWGPAVVFLAVIALGVAVAYWAVYYVDIYQVEAIEHYL